MQLKLETCAGVLGHWHRPQRDDKSSRPAHIRPMAKKPDSRKGKDPARPTRSKAAREPLAPIAPALEKLLNPGIAKGTAGIGSGTGLSAPSEPPKRTSKLPGEGVKEKEPPTGLQP